jgi:hypothetical protein
VLAIWQANPVNAGVLMSVIPTEFAVRPDGAALQAPSAISVQWDALHDAAGAVAALAGLAAEDPGAQVRDFPALIHDAGGWRLDLASNGIADLAAMMTPGVRALLAVSTRGQDPTPAALTLWREYQEARDALLALVPGRDALGPLPTD